MKCKECEDYRPFNNSAYGYCKMTMNNVSENGLCFNPSKQTNADRIRSMTDEQIEKWYWWMHQEMMHYTDSVEFLHQWLKQEVDGDADGQTEEDL